MIPTLTDLLIWLDWLEEMLGVDTLHLRRKVSKRGSKFHARSSPPPKLILRWLESEGGEEFGSGKANGRLIGNGRGKGSGDIFGGGEGGGEMYDLDGDGNGMGDGRLGIDGNGSGQVETPLSGIR